MKNLFFVFVLIFGPLGVFAQNNPLSIQGTVVDVTGLPVPGAFVQEVGTSNGTTTDF